MNISNLILLLTQSKPVSPIKLPVSFGIYALWDHVGIVRYIGCTPKATEGFNVRVANKHVTGSEGRSHKFSHAYCVGRMWRYSSKMQDLLAGSDEDKTDAKIAKRLRTTFIRKYCGVTFVEVPRDPASPNYFSYLTGIEREVQGAVPPEMRAWEGVRFSPVSEPTDLVDAVLSDFPTWKDAAERQSGLFAKWDARQTPRR